jgi:hemoglobin-like flavoprotein
VAALACEQKVDNLAGIWSAIDVIAEKHLNYFCSRAQYQVVIDTRKDLAQEVGAPVHVSDSIDAVAGWDCGFFLSQARR